LHLLIDTHCHLNHDQFQDDYDEAILRAQEAGVHKIIVVGFDMPSSIQAIELSEKYQGLYASIGVHPHESKSYSSEDHNLLKQMLENPHVVALGEIGLDYHYDFSPQDAQKAAFIDQMHLACDASMPVIFHCRDAYREMLNMLKDVPITGVMHCWAGNKEEAELALSRGFMLGFGGMITFKNAEWLRNIAKNAPIDRIVLETDAPYLAPTPYRGKRNEPLYVLNVAEKLAEIKKMPIELLTQETGSNARRLFSRLKD
jgi:TatD DNase family protein